MRDVHVPVHGARHQVRTEDVRVLQRLRVQQMLRVQCQVRGQGLTIIETKIVILFYIDIEFSQSLELLCVTVTTKIRPNGQLDAITEIPIYSYATQLTDF